jgi:hypothetical protein
MEIKINMDERSGKITAFTILGDDLSTEAMERAFLFVKGKLDESAGSARAAGSVMAKDIDDLSADRLTIKDRLKLFLKFEYPTTWFGTIDVKGRYEKQYGEEIKISTVSTYLSRLHNEGFLERRGNKIEREYRIAPIAESPVQGAPVPGPQSRP